ncbi:flavin reductase [Micromonospora sp. CA-240977]|uniref:flavin reductase n=1 Tax=Micromonospora sp. CA-240977 TaxID=3239957 RepID=UPI003D9096D9
MTRARISAEICSCRNRSRRLLIEYVHDRLSLTFYLGLHLADAAADLPNTSADRLHARFLGGIRPRPP